jgi:hypothetical protein
VPSNYTLQDCEETHREFPRSFSIPRAELRRALEPGWLVKLVFTLPEPVENYGAERMWVEVLGARDHGYTGRLDNHPKFVKDLAHGDDVVFEARHVAALENHDERRLAPLVGVGVDVLYNDAWPTWIVKVEPTTKHDSGWRVFSANEAERGATVRAISTSTLFRSWSVTDSAIDVGWDGVWRWDADTFEYLRADALPAPLEDAAHGDLGRLHRPHPDPELSVVITKRVLDGVAPRTAQRLPLSKGHEAEDSGWCIYVGDESQGELDNPSNSTVVAIARVLHDFPYVERVLGESALATWTWDDAIADWKKVPGSERKKTKKSAKKRKAAAKKPAKKPAKKAAPTKKPAAKKPAKKSPKKSKKR